MTAEKVEKEIITRRIDEGLPSCYGESPGEECAVDCIYYEECKGENEDRQDEFDFRPLDQMRVRF